MHILNISFDYNNIFILLTLINIIIPFILQYNYIQIFLYLNTLSLNYIMYKDLYFEIKNKYSNINFILMPNFYPSNRTYNKYIWYTNTIFIYSGIILYCYDFWMNKYDRSNYDLEYMASFSFVSFITLFNIIAFLILLTYSSLILSSFVLDNIKIMSFNYLNKQPLFYNPTVEYSEYICWVCERALSKHKTIKKLNCPCQEYFHPDCIDKYLGLYNNFCREGHRIAKFEHNV